MDFVPIQRGEMQTSSCTITVFQHKEEPALLSVPIPRAKQTSQQLW